MSCAFRHVEYKQPLRPRDLQSLIRQPGVGCRVPSGDLWRMQRRRNNRYLPQRFACPGGASDAIVALGATMAPGLKRLKRLTRAASGQTGCNGL